jgi:hypothetical protein
VRLIAEGRGDRASIQEIISGRLGWTHPDIAGFLTGMGLDALDIPGGLAPRALRDIQAGQAAGRFTVPDRPPAAARRQPVTTATSKAGVPGIIVIGPPGDSLIAPGRSWIARCRLRRACAAQVSRPAPGVGSVTL